MEIVPCFKCGCFLPLVKERPESFLGNVEFTVTCWDCGNSVTTWADTREEALEVWNKAQDIGLP